MRLLKQYHHGFLILLYGIFYIIFFSLLEQRQGVAYFVISDPLTDKIPFCEYFVVPYLFWFVYMLIALLFFVFVNPYLHEYYQLILSLGTGMTLFLLISWIWPNSLNIRPQDLSGDSIFIDIVKVVYRVDTPTNVFPSIHVFNSLVIHNAYSRSKTLAQDQWLKWGSLLITLSIIASTLFMKQHSILDVLAGFILSLFTSKLFYKSPIADSLLYRFFG